MKSDLNGARKYNLGYFMPDAEPTSIMSPLDGSYTAVEMCIQAVVFTGFDWHGKWSHAKCEEKRPFFCDAISIILCPLILTNGHLDTWAY